jgi:cytochrome c peroxidase
MGRMTRRVLTGVGASCVAAACAVGVAAIPTAPSHSNGPEVNQRGASDDCARPLPEGFGDDLLRIDCIGDPLWNPSGRHQTLSLAGSVDTSNEFLQSLGANGRACVTCHAPADGFGLSAHSVRQRFLATCDWSHTGASCGEDPLFRPIDGATSPLADVSTNQARVAAYRLLLTKGLIRIERDVPVGAEFEVIAIDDPYSFATPTKLQFYRRPLLTTNLRFQGAFEPPVTNAPAIMWDGRESETQCALGPTPPGDACSATQACPNVPGVSCVAGFCRLGATQCVNPPLPRNPFDNLKSQANNATITHAEGGPLTDAQLASIVNFERGLFTAQVVDGVAGSLTLDGANGGPAFLSTVPFFTGENRARPIGPGQRPDVFHVYDAWQADTDARRASIARGQFLFNFRTGILPLLGSRTIGGSTVRCGTCHNAFEAGAESAGTWGNGVTDSIGRFLAGPSRRSPDLPLYTVRNTVTGETIQTTDLGRAMTTGKWADLNKFKTPALRALAAHAPYRHDGSDATLEDVIDSYQAAGFSFNFTKQEKADLVAFLKSL